MFDTRRPKKETDMNIGIDRANAFLTGVALGFVLGVLASVIVILAGP